MSDGFQTLLGISSVKVGLKLTSKSSDGDINDTDFEDVSTVVKFLVDLLMRLTSSPKIPLSAQGKKLISQSEEAVTVTMTPV